MTRSCRVIFSTLILAAVSACRAAAPPPPAMFRANPQHTGTFETRGVPEFGEVAWKFETGWFNESSPAIAAGVVYFGGYDGLYAVR